ncbi:MAG: archaeal heat shock protein Hsp20 [Methanotrichaceae archaeon]
MRKRKYPSIFDIFESFMKGTPFEERRDEWWSRDPFEDLVKRFEESIPQEIHKDQAKEGRLSEEIKRFGPFVYGFSYTSAPGKEPVFSEFGNIKPSFGGIKPSAGREPLVDVMGDEKGYKIFAELPGVEKENIKLDVSENRVNIESADEKKYFKVIDLDSAVDPDSTKAAYKNGVLSIELEKKEKSKKGKEIEIK